MLGNMSFLHHPKKLGATKKLQCITTDEGFTMKKLNGVLVVS